MLSRYLTTVITVRHHCNNALQWYDTTARLSQYFTTVITVCHHCYHSVRHHCYHSVSPLLPQFDTTVITVCHHCYHSMSPVLLELSGSPGGALGDRGSLTPLGTRPREVHHEPPTPHLCPWLKRPLYEEARGAVSVATVACSPVPRPAGKRSTRSLKARPSRSSLEAPAWD